MVPQRHAVINQKQDNENSLVYDMENKMNISETATATAASD